MVTLRPDGYGRSVLRLRAQAADNGRARALSRGRSRFSQRSRGQGLTQAGDGVRSKSRADDSDSASLRRSGSPYKRQQHRSPERPIHRRQGHHSRYRRSPSVPVRDAWRFALGTPSKDNSPRARHNSPRRSSPSSPSSMSPISPLSHSWSPSAAAQDVLREDRHNAAFGSGHANHDAMHEDIPSSDSGDGSPGYAYSPVPWGRPRHAPTPRHSCSPIRSHQPPLPASAASPCMEVHSSSLPHLSSLTPAMGSRSPKRSAAEGIQADDGTPPQSAGSDASPDRSADAAGLSHPVQGRHNSPSLSEVLSESPSESPSESSLSESASNDDCANSTDQKCAGTG